MIAIARERFVRVVIVTSTTVGFANLVAELGIYSGLIVPRFGDAHVPFIWWVIMYAPVFVACVGVSRTLRSIRDVLGAALTAGVITMIEKLALAAAAMPGHTRGLGFEEALRLCAVLLVRMTFGYAVLFAVLVAARHRRT